jgi:hypothetical protein
MYCVGPRGMKIVPGFFHSITRQIPKKTVINIRPRQNDPMRNSLLAQTFKSNQIMRTFRMEATNEEAAMMTNAEPMEATKGQMETTNEQSLGETNEG